MALCTIGDTIVRPLAPLSPAKAEPGPLVLRPEQYVWDRVMREWVSAPPVWLGATPEWKVAYLEHWRWWRLAEKCTHARQVEQMEREAKAWEEERHAAQRGSVQPPANDVAVAWQPFFHWVGPPPTLVDLTGPDEDYA
ncbi:hypothetical protein D1007_44078 [Hordeum vulgare]|nr:hypothetical protein D1007_44078 [Hordeum vulgare]